MQLYGYHIGRRFVDWAYVLVFLVVEGFQGGGLVGLDGRDGTLEHRPPICGRCQLRFRKRLAQAAYELAK
jgi:hypothetical protein